MRKISREEIEIAGREVHDTYYNEGYCHAREKADELQARMVLTGATTSDDISAFERSTGLSYQGK